MNRVKLQYKIVMHFGCINSPSLDLACPQAITELGKPVHKFRELSVDKKNTDKKHQSFSPNSSILNSNLNS